MNSDKIVNYIPLLTLISGNSCTFTLDNQRNVFSFGNNHHCKLAHPLNDDKKIYPPQQITNLINIKMVSCGDFHSICLDFEGFVFGFGRNDVNQVGIDNNTNCNLNYIYRPTKIDIPPIDYISCGNYFTFCKTFDGCLFSFGSNSDGELGLGHYNTWLPQEIKDINNIEFIECGGHHSICKTVEGDYYSWGRGNSGQLGLDNIESKNKPTKCNNWPDNIASIKCNGSTSLFLTYNGYVYACGDNGDGCCGKKSSIKYVKFPSLVKELPLIKRIEVGYAHALCIDIDNNLWIFGYNGFSQLGIGNTKNIYKPYKHPNISNVIDISNGGFNTMVKTTDGIYAMGSNDSQQSGVVNINEIKKPTKVEDCINEIWGTNERKSRAKSARK